MQLKITDIPEEEIIEEYNIHELVDNNGYVYCKITTGIYGYGLPQMGIIAQDLLAENLAKHRYHQSGVAHCSGAWYTWEPPQAPPECQSCFQASVGPVSSKIEAVAVSVHAFPEPETALHSPPRLNK